MKNITKQLIVLLLAFIQSVFAAGALAMVILIFTLEDVNAFYILMYLVIAAVLFVPSTIPAKIILKMKGKLNGYSSSKEIYFNNNEGLLRRKRFHNWAEMPIYATLIWFIMGPIVFFIQLLAVAAALLALAIPPMHSQVGQPEYCEYNAETLQNIVNFLFGFTVGGITCGQYFAQIDELMKNAEADNNAQ